MANVDVLVDVDFNGNELQNAVDQNLASAPANPKEGQFYWNSSTHEDMIYNGTAWVSRTAQGTTYTEGAGIDITNAVISIDLATGANAGNITLSTTNGLAGNAPTASTSTAGLIEIATDTEVATGTDTSRAVTPKQLAGKVNKLTTAPTAGTYTKLTINADGLVTSGGTLQASDIPSLTLSKISDVTATASELNVLDGITASTAELNIMDGVTVTASDINSVTSKIGLSDLSIDSGSTNYLGYNSSSGKFSAKVDTTVGTVSTNLITSGAVNTALGNKLDKKPDGTNNLIDSGNKVALTYLPDVILGQMLYAGTFAPSTAVATLTTNAKTKLGTSSDTITLTNNTTAITGYVANEGCYYIATASGTFASISFETGDWLISTGSAWKKVDNTDAVTGVKGNAETNYRTGNVNITADNVMPTQTGNSGKYLTTDGTNVSWGTVDALPSQTGNSGKFLTTNGTSASWADAVTASSTTTFTNKTFNANGTGNSITNLETADFASGVIQTSVRSTSSASDTALATEKAVATALSVRNTRTMEFYNPALTSESGVCTWTLTSLLSTIPFTNIDVYENLTGKKIVCSVEGAPWQDTTPSIKLNSTTNIEANKYIAIVTGAIA